MNLGENQLYNESVQTDFSSEYDVRLEFFSGPMDLLLHLVSVKEVPIEEVSMYEILDQYCSIVTRQAHQIDLEKASEYLVIITTLMVLKSKSLLPAEVEEGIEDETDLEYSRFFESLRERLKAFEMTKMRAQALIDSPQLGVDTFTRIDKNAVVVPPEMIAEGETSSRLGALFLSLVKRVGGLGKRLKISIEPVSIVDSMMRVVDSLRSMASKPSQPFLSILKTSYSKKDFQNRTNSRNIIMGGFIAVLELAKRGVVAVAQSSQSDTISVSLRIHEMQDGEESEFVSEFDQDSTEEQSLLSDTTQETEEPIKRVSNG